MKNKNGISMVVLIITITIMLILLSTATIGGIATVNNSKKISFANEISMLEGAIKNYTIINDGSYPVKGSVVLDLKQCTNELEQFSNEVISTTSKVVLNEIDYDKLEYKALKYGTGDLGENDIYLLSTTTGKVYYAKGINVGNKTYFSYTEDLKKLLKFNTEKNFDMQKAVVSFKLNTTDWTNKEVEVTAKIPISFTVLSVMADNEEILLSSQDSMYYYYTISKASNYTVEVVYKNDSSSGEKIAKYSVENYDEVSPTILIDKDNQVYIDSLANDQIGYVKILDKSDNLSGIKYMKYEDNSLFNKENILNKVVNMEDVKSHFENNGKIILNDTIPINKNAKDITVYIEDNTGNWSLDTFTVNNVNINIS